MKWKRTLALLSAVLIAGLVAYSFSKKPTSAEHLHAARKILPGLKAGEVVELEIEREGFRLVCRRDAADRGSRAARSRAAGNWRITRERRAAGPLKLRADTRVVEGILAKLQSAAIAGWPSAGGGSDEARWAEYGLATPAVKVTVRTGGPGARSHTLLIGKGAGAGDLVYATRGDTGLLYLIDRAVAEKLGVTLGRLRSKHLVNDIPVERIDGIEVREKAWKDSPGFTAVCVRKGAVWEMRAPVGDLASAEAVYDLAHLLNSHLADEDDFVTDDPAKAADYGLDDPELTLTFRLPEEERTLVLGRDVEAGTESYYAMNAPEQPIVRVPKTLFESLRKTPEELRSRSLADFSPKRIASLTISRTGGALTVRRSDEDWEITGPQRARADAPAVGDILGGLRTAEVVEFVDDAPSDLGRYGLDRGSAMEVVAQDDDGSEVARVQLGSDGPDGKTVYARRPDYDAVLSLAREPWIADLRAGRLALLERTVLSEDARDAVAIATGGGGRRFRCERDGPGEAWRLVEPVKGPTDQAAAQEIVRAFAGLRARRFVDESADDLAAPLATVEITYRKQAGEQGPKGGGPHARTLLIGRESGAEGNYAKLEGDPRIFILDARTVAAMTAPLASRVICRVRGLRRIDFRGAGRSLSFEREGRTSAWRDENGEIVNEAVRARLEAVRRLLADFRAGRIVAYARADGAAFGLDRPTLTVTFDDEAVAGKQLVVGKRAGEEGYYLTGSESSFVLVASPEDVQKLLAAIEQTD